MEITDGRRNPPRVVPPDDAPHQARHTRSVMIALGIILLVVGFILSVPVLWTIGIIVLVIGLILALLGMAGREIGGRRHYY